MIHKMIREWIDKYIEAVKEKISDLYARLFVKEEEIDTPYLVSTISINEVKGIVKDMCDVNHIYLSDWKYGLTSPALAKKFCRQTRVHIKQYSKQYDCDNFSFASHSYWNEQLENFAYGIAWSKSHAFNFMIDHNKEIWIVEPQTNVWYTWEQAKKSSKYYPIVMVML